jgi:hypothetical protein
MLGFRGNKIFLHLDCSQLPQLFLSALIGIWEGGNAVLSRDSGGIKLVPQLFLYALSGRSEGGNTFISWDSGGIKFSSALTVARFPNCFFPPCAEDGKGEMPF